MEYFVMVSFFGSENITTFSFSNPVDASFCAAEWALRGATVFQKAM